VQDQRRASAVSTALACRVVEVGAGRSAVACVVVGGSTFACVGVLESEARHFWLVDVAWFGVVLDGCCSDVSIGFERRLKQCR